jgi:hypothetical protein
MYDGTASPTTFINLRRGVELLSAKDSWNVEIALYSKADDATILRIVVILLLLRAGTFSVSGTILVRSTGVSSSDFFAMIVDVLER